MHHCSFLLFGNRIGIVSTLRTEVRPTLHCYMTDKTNCQYYGWFEKNDYLVGNINIRLLQLRWIDGPLHPASILLWDALRGSRYMKTNFCCSNVLLFAANHGARPKIKPQAVLLPYILPLNQVSENWMANSHLRYLCHWTFVPWQPLYKQRSNIKSHVVLLPHNLALKQVSGKSGELTHLISLHQVTPDSFMHTATWLWRSHETKADDLPKTSSDERQQKRIASCLQWHQLHETQHPSLSSPCCAVLTTKLKAMNRFQSYTFNVLAPHSKIEFECS